MKKAESNHWLNLLKKSSDIGLGQKGGAIDKLSEGEDPQASLMGMMKNLYETGDAEMKKTIAESWQKAQDQNPGLGGM